MAKSYGGMKAPKMGAVMKNHGNTKSIKPDNQQSNKAGLREMPMGTKGNLKQSYNYSY